MKEYEQQKAIAEVCGWTGIEDMSEQLMLPSPLYVGYPPKDVIVGQKCDLPDFLHDLNAMCQAEATLDENGIVSERNDYAGKLWEIVHPTPHMGIYWLAWCIARATAAQRAEAFLRTKGLWT